MEKCVINYRKVQKIKSTEGKCNSKMQKISETDRCSRKMKQIDAAEK